MYRSDPVAPAPGMRRAVATPSRARQQPRSTALGRRRNPVMIRIISCRAGQGWARTLRSGPRRRQTDLSRGAGRHGRGPGAADQFSHTDPEAIQAWFGENFPGYRILRSGVAGNVRVPRVAMTGPARLASRTESQMGSALCPGPWRIILAVRRGGAELSCMDTWAEITFGSMFGPVPECGWKVHGS
jgi:hypothetical protein